MSAEQFNPSDQGQSTRVETAGSPFDNAEFEASKKAVEAQLGDFNPWEASRDDPRWDLLEQFPSEVATLNAEKKAKDDRRVDAEHVAHLSSLPMDERGGAWNMARSDYMDMKGNPLDLTNPNLAAQWRAEKSQAEVQQIVDRDRRSRRLSSRVVGAVASVARRN